MLPAFPWLPPAEKPGERHEADDPCHHIDQRRPHIVGHGKLHHGEGSATDEDRRPNGQESLPTGHRGHHPGRHDEREEGELTASHLGNGELVEAGHLRQRDDRGAKGAKGDRRRVGDEGEAGGLEGGKSRAGEQRCRDGDRRPETRSPFEEGPEGKGDQEGLHAMVGGEPGDRPLHDLEGPGLERELVEKHRRHDDPADREEAESSPMQGGGQGGVGRHAADSHGYCQGGGQARPGGRVGRPAGSGQKPEQGHQRQHCHQR